MLAMAAVPTATAAVTPESLDVNLTAPDRMVMTINVEFSGNEAQGMREQADSNQNGVVSQQEADDINKQLDDSTAYDDTSDDPFMDDKAAKTSTTKSQVVSGLVGAVTASVPIEMRSTRTLTYVLAAADTHTLHNKPSTDSSPPSSPVPVTVHAPPGFIITATTGLPLDAKISADKSQVTFTDVLGGDRDETFVFSKAPVGGVAKAPVLAPGLLLGVLGLVALTRRRNA